MRAMDKMRVQIYEKFPNAAFILAKKRDYGKKHRQTLQYKASVEGSKDIFLDGNIFQPLFLWTTTGTTWDNFLSDEAVLVV